MTRRGVRILTVPRKRVAILGGGVASLAAAFELTRTPELREQYEVTVYQMGWRLGGKGATGRNLEPGKGKRIEEHGLHVWLGFYDNAFQLMRDAYAEVQEKGLSPDNPLPNWTDAFKPKNFTPVGIGNGDDWVPVHWPPNHKTPGIDGDNDAVEAIRTVIDFMLNGIRFAFGRHPLRALCIGVRMVWIRWHAGKLATGAATANRPHLEKIHHHIEAMAAQFRKIGTRRGDDDVIAALVLEIVEMGLACMRGFLNPEYGLLEDFDLDRIDQYEFMDWLVDNGAPASLRETRNTNGLHTPRQPFIRALYDLAFAYRQFDRADGKQEMMADFAAGAALRCCLLIVGAYKGAVLYEMQAGMGEVVVAPLYQVLKSRGVTFEFFAKVTDLQLSENRNWVERVVIEQQAATKGDAYQPIFDVGGLPCWPSQPFWGQLVDGDKLRAAGVNFESHWVQYPDGYRPESRTLTLGEHFDTVVLGISLGAFKDFGNGEPSMCAELIDASPAFAAMTQNIGIIPSHAEQLWMTRTLADLGWKDPRPAMVAMVEPIDIWADMTPSIAREDWPSSDPPKSLHYFCGPLNSDTYSKPASDAGVPAQALAEVRQAMTGWLERDTFTIWPQALASGGGGLDWSLLYGGGAKGVERLGDQYLRANVDPTECCPATWSGTTRYRLKAGESGFLNLVLTGDWIRTSTNTAGVDSAVVSGKLAARAICGFPRRIPYEHFFHGKE
jgi:uncharacterized protein with NAD-binding domain and iron-sulfur cluster